MTDSLSEGKVLLVDDVRENIKVLVNALKDDYTLGVAMNGENALEYARTRKPDLILLDIMMPEMDGFEVSRRLRADPVTRDIPFIFITAIDEVGNKTAGFEHGAVDYITKPFEIMEVKARVKTHLSLLKARRALAGQNEQLKHSLCLAMEVQQNLIPQSHPVVEGFDVAGKIIYCDETGGDYFDYIDMPAAGSDKLGIAVGDVSEHGIPSALLMTTARAFLRCRSAFPGSLSTMISEVNRLFASDVNESGRFMTLFFCCLDIENRGISWVRAGHDPAMLYSPGDKKFESLGGKGMPLGIHQDAAFEEHNRKLVTGQIILICTDGLFEAQNSSKEFFGKDRLQKIIREQASNSAQDILRALFDAIESFTLLNTLDDDLTAVVIKVL